MIGDDLRCPNCKAALELETERPPQETWKCPRCFLRVHEKVAEAEPCILVPCKSCITAMIAEDADSPYCALCEELERKLESENRPYVN